MTVERTSPQGRVDHLGRRADRRRDRDHPLVNRERERCSTNGSNDARASSPTADYPGSTDITVTGDTAGGHRTITV
jgi:hypothetical protein